VIEVPYPDFSCRQLPSVAIGCPHSTVRTYSPVFVQRCRITHNYQTYSAQGTVRTQVSNNTKSSVIIENGTGWQIVSKFAMFRL
jgi:hypothetical protein